MEAGTAVCVNNLNVNKIRRVCKQLTREERKDNKLDAYWNDFIVELYLSIYANVSTLNFFPTIEHVESRIAHRAANTIAVWNNKISQNKYKMRCCHRLSQSCLLGRGRESEQWWVMILLLKEDEWRCIANLMFNLGCKCNVAQEQVHKLYYYCEWIWRRENQLLSWALNCCTTTLWNEVQS